MRIIDIKSKFYNNAYRSAYVRAKVFSDKLNAYFLFIRCNDCDVDQFLAKGLAELFNPTHKTIVIYLESYHTSDMKVQKYISQYLNVFDFSNKIFAIAS